MSKPPTKIPTEFSFPPSFAPAPPPLGVLIAHEPRGGPIDQGSVIVGAATLPPVAGSREATVFEERRRWLIAANRAVDGQVVNETAKGTIEGFAVAGLFVVGALFGPEIAVIAGLAALGAAMFGGQR